MKVILIVEDDSTINQALKTKLESSGYTVLCAGDGEEGLALLDQESVDLVLMDIVMPKMDGIEMIYRWHKSRGSTKPIIIMTNLEETAYPDYVDKVIRKSSTNIADIVEIINQSLGNTPA